MVNALIRAMVLVVLAVGPASAEPGSFAVGGKRYLAAGTRTTTRLLSPGSFSSQGVVPGASNLGFPVSGPKANFGNQTLPPCATSSCIGLDVVDGLSDGPAPYFGILDPNGPVPVYGPPDSTQPAGEDLSDSRETPPSSPEPVTNSLAPEPKFYGANPYLHSMFRKYGYVHAPSPAPAPPVDSGF